MSIRSNWCEYDKETRKYIKKRDNNECFICHNKGALQIMHIFISRAKGGKGCKENGVLGCVKCHRIIDNPIGIEQNKLSQVYLNKCKQYLIDKENIKYNNEFINSLKFDKKEYLQQKNINKEIHKERCKNCKYLIKNKFSNSSIPTYYCKIKKKIQNKNNEVCNVYKNSNNS
jgi:hypothetical protein